jgi:two-component system response regulator YesN
VDLLRREIESRMTDPDFHVGDALARLPMSPDHLRRLFAQEMGCSPLAYLHQKRIGRAKILLREGRGLVKEVAAQVGLPDEYYFSRLFLKHTGQRPQAYRRSLHAIN